MEGQGLQENITVQGLLTTAAELLELSEEKKEEAIRGWTEMLGYASNSLVGLKTLIAKKDRWERIHLDETVKALLESAFDNLPAASGDGKGTGIETRFANMSLSSTDAGPAQGKEVSPREQDAKRLLRDVGGGAHLLLEPLLERKFQLFSDCNTPPEPRAVPAQASGRFVLRQPPQRWRFITDTPEPRIDFGLSDFNVFARTVDDQADPEDDDPWPEDMDAVQTVLRCVQEKTPVLLIGVSGSGKTFIDMNIARSVPCLFFDAGKRAGHDDVHSLLKCINTYFIDLGIDNEAKQRQFEETVVNLVLLMLCIRSMALLIVTKHDADPVALLNAQLGPLPRACGATLRATWRTVLEEKCDPNILWADLSRIFHERFKTDVCVILDEAQELAKPMSFKVAPAHSPIKKKPGVMFELEDERPIVALFDRAMRTHCVTVISGTSLALRQMVEIMGSNTIKMDFPAHKVVTMPYFDSRRVEQLLAHWLDLTQVSPDVLHTYCSQLAGRGRLVGDFLQIILQRYTGSEHDIESFLASCWSDFESLVLEPSTLSDHNSLYDLIERWVKTQDRPVIQEYLLNAIMSGKIITFRHDADLSPSDLFWVADVSKRKLEWRIGEPMIVRAACKYFANTGGLVGSVVDLFASNVNLLGQHNPVKGFLLEVLVNAQLLTYHGEKMSDKPWFTPLKKLAAYAGLAETDRRMLENLQFPFQGATQQAASEEFCQFLANNDTHSTLLFPKNVVGPDLVGFLADDVLLTCACRIYSGPLTKAGAEQNRRSSDPFFCYYQADGTRPNPSCSKLRASVLNELRKHKIKFCVRLVIALSSSPSDIRYAIETIQSPQGKAPMTSFIVPITVENYDKLFDGRAKNFLHSLLDLLGVTKGGKRK